MGPHPYPFMVRQFHRVIGDEAFVQMNDATGTTPDFVGVATLGDSLQQWIGHGEIDVLEVFSGQGAFLAASRALGMTTAGGIDRDQEIAHP
jgi:tryptophan synthase beta subunit